ncbi:MAG: hypothetical protein KDK53_17590 [Maritimibacter sp.]|nr:hypothetical protein [Maritimibacter sp.]
MFDHTTTEKRPWAHEIGPGDVVLFAYPVADPESGARPKYRPCLVIEAEETAMGKRVVLAYGTSVPAKGPQGYTIAVRSATDLLVAGLEKPTRFDAGRLMSVSVHSSKFGIRDRATPVIGHLSSAALVRMNRVRARLHAEADMASERRRERATRSRFTVERRVRKQLVPHI